MLNREEQNLNWDAILESGACFTAVHNLRQYIKELEDKVNAKANTTTISDCPAEVKVGILEELVKRCYSEARSELSEDTVEQIQDMFGKEALEDKCQ